MTKAERLACVFAIAFAIIYAPTMDLNWTAATYHPIQGIWQWGKAAPLGGGSPAMYWYGFVVTAALGAFVVTGLAALVPERLMERVPWLSATWVVALCSIAYITYVLLRITDVANATSVSPIHPKTSLRYARGFVRQASCVHVQRFPQ